MLCLAPFGAQAFVVNGTETEPLEGYITPQGEAINVTNMNIGIQIEPGMEDDGNFNAGTFLGGKFTVRSDEDITISNQLFVNDGYYLALAPYSEGSATEPVTINVTVQNNINALGELVISNANNFSVTNGTVINNGFSLSANSMSTGAISLNNTGNTNIKVADAATIGSFSNNSTGTANFTAGSITVENGDIENGDFAGDMTISSTGNLDVNNGSIYNSNSKMTIDVDGDVYVKGSIKNDSDVYSEKEGMYLSANNLIVKGGNAEEGSFANSGNLVINVENETNLSYGFDLSAMNSKNKFSLTTGTLVFGEKTNPDMWLNVFSNKLEEFALTITKSGLEINSNVINGVGNDVDSNVVYNTDANMSLIATELSINGSITNSGKSLIINATDQEGAGIKITEAVIGRANSETSIASRAELDIGGDVSNYGTMDLNGAQVQMQSASNNGGNLSITAYTNAIGKITAKDITNISGTTYINAKDIEISGYLKNADGTTTVQGSDTNNGAMQIGAVAVNGGLLSINTLKGGVNIDGALSVTSGTMNINNSTYSVTAGQTIQINNDFNVGGTSSTPGKGDVYVDASGPQQFIMSSEDVLNIGGNISAEQSGNSYNVTLAGKIITVGKGVVVKGANNKLTFATDSSQQLTVNGALSASNGATVGIVADDANVGSLSVDEKSTLLASGTQITATEGGTEGGIDIGNGIWFNASKISSKPTSGLIVEGTDNLTLKSDKADVKVGGPVDLGAANTLSLEAGNSISVGGMINAAGTLNLIANSNSVILPNISIAGLNILNGGKVNVNSDVDSVYMGSSGAVSVNGDVIQGIPTSTQAGALNLLANDIKFAGTSLNVSGNYYANSGTAIFDFSDAVVLGDGDNGNISNGNINVADGADVTFGAASFMAKNISNSGSLTINSDKGINLALITNTGVLSLDSGAGMTNVDNFASGNLGTVTLKGKGLNSKENFTTQNAMLYQNYSGLLEPGTVNVVSDDYTITATNFEVAGIDQVSGKMQINASTVNVSGDIMASDLRFAKNQADTWIDATIEGTVSGGVDFWGIKSLDIVNGSYVFNNDSDLWAAIMPKNTSKYWSEIKASETNKIGEIINQEGGEALITVGDKFVSNISGIWNETATTKPQVGITLFDTVDQGSAIWLLHANNGISVTEEFEKLRNLDVQFCNADGTICVSYLDTLNKPGFGEYNGSDDKLPIYISERDTDGDGVADSLYIVFDPSFGGPVEVFKIQPIVGVTEPHTKGEYVSAGALDDLIAGQLLNTKFFNGTPIELIPQIFKGTNLSQMADELYDRMEYYNMTGDGTGLARFSRLFQARELEQIAGNIVLNEHTNFRDFEDRMFDEFIWNRNRSLKKAWLDVDYGMFFQNVSDGKHADGQRFNIAGGFDWQNSETTILGLTARVSNSSSDNSDTVDLGYLPKQSLLTNVDMTVDDLNIGLGGYLMKILGEKTRLYGNAFLDIHLLDISRDQALVDHIDGSGTAFSLISEWGLLHDWLNQYIVGNMYARVGYNFGFDVTEHAAGQDYMDMQSDGYLILTPGYSLTAQKRIYPSSWFQIRPYASIGVEYDVLGAPDYVKYKFALAHTYTKYDVDIDPLWANIGGGIEFLSVTGIQVGLDYRYQYNDSIQLHNIKISGSYRF